MEMDSNRTRSSFRKACLSRFPSHPPGAHWHRKKRPICFEGPFGENLRATGPMAKANPFRFSTKYQDDETDLLYYGRRYYNVSSGAWIARDPIEEDGGENLYGFVYNNSITRFDYLGLCKCEGKLSLAVDPVAFYNGPDIARFRVDIDAKYSNECKCCSYHQLATGHIRVNGVELVYPSGSGYNITDEVYVQDGADNQDNTSQDICRYTSVDHPGFEGGGLAGSDRVEFKLTLKGQILDTCNGNKVVDEKSITIYVVGKSPRKVMFE